MFNRKFILTCIGFLMVVWAHAQPGGGGDPGGGGNPVPLTGIELLLAAGGLYGAAKMLKAKGSKNRD